MATGKRQYELVVYGATGYTGKYAVEHLQQHAPTDLKWAIAGRNAQKLEDLAAQLKGLNGDRTQPGVETINHNLAELEALAQKTRVLISTVGPYCVYGDPVVEACAKSGTHYLDVTGELPWVYGIIEKYDTLAKKNKCAIIPQCGIDSVPSDILAYVLASYIRNNYSEGTEKCVNAIMKANGDLSGGTSETMFALLSTYSLSYLMKTSTSFSLCATPPSPDRKTGAVRRGFFARTLGYGKVPELGVLTPWPLSLGDEAAVNRSWELFDNGALYGCRFRFEMLFRVRGVLGAVLYRSIFNMFALLVALPPTRWLVRKLLPKPGEGASREVAETQFLKYKALATSESGKRVTATLDLNSSAYICSGLFVAEAALEILRGSGGRAVKEGGVTTTATLEMGFVERLEKAGFPIKISELSSPLSKNPQPDFHQ